MTQIKTDNTNLNMKSYFNKQGAATRPTADYFNADDNLILSYEIELTYKQYPSDSDIVKMYYSEQLSNECGMYTCRETYNKIK